MPRNVRPSPGSDRHQDKTQDVSKYAIHMSAPRAPVTTDPKESSLHQQRGLCYQAGRREKALLIIKRDQTSRVTCRTQKNENGGVGISCSKNIKTFKTEGEAC